MTGTDTGASRLRLLFLGRFEVPVAAMEGLPGTGPSDLWQCADANGLPDSLGRADVVLAGLRWLESLEMDERAHLQQRLSAVGAWVALCDDRLELNAQLTWLRAGVTHLVNAPLAPERLAAVIADVRADQGDTALSVWLVAGDEAVSAYADVLRRAGMRVFVALDPHRLVDMAANLPAPDLLLAAWELPGCSGPELLALLRRREAFARLPGLFVAGTAESHGLSREADDLLLTPVAPHQLVAAVESRVRVQRGLLPLPTAGRRDDGTATGAYDVLLRAIDAQSIVSATNPAGDINYVNDRFCAVSGYTREELLGQNHRLLKSGEHPATFYHEMWQILSRGQVWQGELCNRHKDGHAYWVDATIAPVFDQAGCLQQYVSIRTDISALKARESFLHLSEERLRHSQAFANIGTLDWDLATGGVHYSERVPYLFGGPAPTMEVNYDNFIQAVHPDDRRGVIDAIANSLSCAEPYELEYRMVWADGTVRWLHGNGLVLRDKEGKAVRVLGVAQDIDDRKRTELALEESERRLLEAQHLAKIGNWQFDCDTGRTLWSAEMFVIFGCDPGNFEPSHEALYARLHPDDVASIQRGEEELLREGTHDMVHRVVTPDGTLRYVHNIARVERNADGIPVRLLGVVQDVTERIEAEARLRSSEASFSFAVEGAGDGIWNWNLLTGAMPVSACCETMLGYAPGELEPTNAAWNALLHADDRDRVYAQILGYLKGKLPAYAIEQRFLCKDGGYKWILCRGTILERDQKGYPTRMIGIHSDISERKAAEDALILYRRIYDATSQCICISDGQGIVRYQNAAFTREMGYAPDELMGKPHWVFRVADGDESGIAAGWAALRERGMWTGVLPYRRKDGSVFMASAHIGVVRDDDGEAQYLFTLFTDFSEELARRNELSQAKEAAERASQAKSNFLSSMSHELRTPMNAIIGFAQMLECDAGLNADQLDSVDEILKGGRHLLDLINEVLDLAKIESGGIDLSLEPVDLAMVVADCRQLIQPLAAKRRIALNTRIAEETLIRGDRVRLKQVLLNLLSNAVKYNRDGGEINLMALATLDGCVHIEVNDSGFGIAPEHMGQLFQPFCRLGADQGAIEGTGIGLTITRRLVEMMGGTLGAESQLGTGSTFWVELPVATPAPAHAATGADATGKPPAIAVESRRRVLCIDDNPVNLKLVAQMLGKRPHVALITAHTGALGIELALAQRPDLILLDINMPGLNGYQVLKVLKADAQLAHIPVVAITANAMLSDTHRGRAAGFADYLTKPIDMGLFLNTVDGLLAACTKDIELS